MARVGAVAIGLMLASSCGTAGPPPGPLNRAALRSTQPRSIVTRSPPPPAFGGVPSGVGIASMVAGVAGAAVYHVAVGAEVEDAIARESVKDPALAIGFHLTEALAKRFTLRVAPANAVPPPAKRPPPTDESGSPSNASGPAATAEAPSLDELAAQNPHAHLLLEVQTSRWGFQAVRLAHYGTFYEGTLRLIDLRTRAVIAEGTCVSYPTDTHDAPILDELFADHARLLKEQLNVLETYCTDDYRTRILGLVGP